MVAKSDSLYIKQIRKMYIFNKTIHTRKSTRRSKRDTSRGNTRAEGRKQLETLFTPQTKIKVPEAALEEIAAKKQRGEIGFFVSLVNNPPPALLISVKTNWPLRNYFYNHINTHTQNYERISFNKSTERNQIRDKKCNKNLYF